MVKNSWLLVLFVLSLLACTEQPYQQEGRSYIFSNKQGEKIKVTPYGDQIVRIQNARKDSSFFKDDRYEMVVSHDWPGKLDLTEAEAHYLLENGFIRLKIDKKTLNATYHLKDNSKPLLKEKSSITRKGNEKIKTFRYDPKEHFAGMGHTYKGRQKSLDLRGQKVYRNYGRKGDEDKWIEAQDVIQAPLIVPFYISSKGYGVFLNSTFPNQLNFGKNKRYSIAIDDKGFGGQLDYFFIPGPKPKKILNLYTRLTGRPRLPQLSIFGLQLSDKVHDHTHKNPSDMGWWKNKIQKHRKSGWPFDHIVNDNRWRAQGGKRCESVFAWSEKRYPNPVAYNKWCNDHGVTVTIDFNRCIAGKSKGWSDTMNIVRDLEGIEAAEVNPDFSDPDIRQWFWKIMYNKVFDPKLNYPGDAIWVDEFDALANIPYDAKMANGRTWAENANYYYFLIAKALVEEGWEEDTGERKRPYVWVRGMTAGGQRYATLWSGDIKPEFNEMKNQIRAMQSAGISGFPFWGHDAGGFADPDDWKNPNRPDDTLYAQWSMAFGSFAPILKPHGPGYSRWPNDRGENIEPVMRKYLQLRYRLMPYTYTIAHIASNKGIPMARPMVLEHPDNEKAWKNDLQYKWGDQMLVAPNPKPDGKLETWLPRGKWFNFWNDSLYTGQKTISQKLTLGELPLFVKAGSILPMYDYAQSTFYFDKSHLNLHVYTGSSGEFTLIEDDGVTEKYKTNGKLMKSKFIFEQEPFSLKIDGGKGTYKGAPEKRHYTIYFHGLSKPFALNNSEPVKDISWKKINGKEVLVVNTASVDIHKSFEIKKK